MLSETSCFPSQLLCLQVRAATHRVSRTTEAAPHLGNWHLACFFVTHAIKTMSLLMGIVSRKLNVEFGNSRAAAAVGTLSSDFLSWAVASVKDPTGYCSNENQI